MPCCPRLTVSDFQLVALSMAGVNKPSTAVKRPLSGVVKRCIHRDGTSWDGFIIKNHT